MSKIIIAIVAATIFALVGGFVVRSIIGPTQQVEMPPPSQPTPTIPVTQPVVPKPAAQPKPITLKECEILQNDIAKANCYHFSALKLHEEKYCEKSGELTCFPELAVIKKDEKLCERVPSVLPPGIPPGYRVQPIFADTCYVNFAEMTFDTKYCDKIAGPTTKSQCLKFVTENKDCALASDKNYCLSKHAFAELNASACDAITDAAKRENCKVPVYLQRAKINNSLAECNQLTGSVKDFCVESLAIINGNYGLCLQTSAAYKNNCYSNYAKKRLDYEVCGKISTEQEAGSLPKDQCFYAVAVGTLDAAICKNIQNESLKLTCFKIGGR